MAATTDGHRPLRHQLWQRPAGKLALLGAGLFLLLAVTAPLLASPLPIVRNDVGEALWSPLFVSLLDPGVYAGPAERLFNCLLVAALALLLASPGLLLVRFIFLPHVRDFAEGVSGFFLAGGLTLFVLTLFPFFSAPFSQPLGAYEPPALGEASVHAPEETAEHLEAATRWRVATPLPHDPRAHAPQRANLEPLTRDPFTGDRHWLGTDARGADAAAVLIHATRPVVALAGLAALLATLAGFVLGLLAAFTGGLFALLMRWLAGVLTGVPAWVLGLFVLGVAPLSPGNAAVWLVAVMAVLMWGGVFRRVDRAVCTELSPEVPLATRALGGTRWQVLTGHLAPAAVPPALCGACHAFAGAVTLKATLMFLELLPRQLLHQPSWGRLLREATEAGNGLLALVTGGAVLVSVLVAHLLAHALKEVARPSSVSAGRSQPRHGL